MTVLSAIGLHVGPLGGLVAWFGMPGWAEIVVIAFVGLLIFGRRLPEVGRSLGKSIVEFKRGVREAKDEISVASTIDQETTRALPPRQPSTAPPQPAASSQPSEARREAAGD